jgi:gamma-glutamyl hydrolase
MRFGIISSPTPTSMAHRAPSYIYQSYITWAEWAGGGVVLIPYDAQNLDEYFGMVDGFIWAGGGIDDARTHPAEQFDRMLRVYKRAYDHAVRENRVRPFPIFGICLGYYLLVFFSQGIKDHILEYLDHAEKFGQESLAFRGPSRLRALFSEAEQRQFARKRSTNHLHHLGFLSSSPFVRQWAHIRVVSVQDGFVNMIEFDNYPFYGTQWHPDRPLTKTAEVVSFRLIEHVTRIARARDSWGNLKRMSSSILIL